MSHFSVCVVIPSTQLISDRFGVLCIGRALEGILEPYYEGTDEPALLEFSDETDAAREEYETETVTAARFPDGKIVTTWSHQFRDRFTVQDEKILEYADDHKNSVETDDSKALTLLSDYPVKLMYSFEEYCEEYHGYRRNFDGRYGYYFNPNAQWDWYEVGGRFSGELLVAENTKYTVDCDSSVTEHPKGFRYVNGAFMKDIAWDKMHELKLENMTKAYRRYADAFNAGDISGLSPIVAITEDGIAGWGGDMLYIKGETLEEFLARKGAADSDLHPISTYAYINKNGEWCSRGDMGWFGLSSNDKPERDWCDELNTLGAQIDDNDYVVIVDCHI